MTTPHRRAAVFVFLTLAGTYAFFWQTRDWNSATRLMLTYAIVDRGTVTLDGLERQTGDRAFFRGHSYTDKLPGFSLMAVIPYAAAKRVSGLPSHPLNTPAIPYWRADYAVTLGTSGLLTAVTGLILMGLARDLGCGPRRSALVALAYGLATPAYTYATLGAGHQSTAFALLASFALLLKTAGKRQAVKVGLAGFLASYAAVIELQVGPVSAILGLYLVAQVVRRDRKATNLGDFAVGALIPAAILLVYNHLAFGSPWDMGYFHHAYKEFADVHNEKNPLGLTGLNGQTAFKLLWGRYRGLLFYAPIVGLAPLGAIALLVRKRWGVAIVSASAMAAVFLVNLSYPEWTGGWSTGPRLLVPLLPFAMVLVAGLLGSAGKWATALAVGLALAGGVVILLFVGVGGRLSHEIKDPLFQTVLPLWRGEPVTGWVDQPLARNLVALAFPRRVESLPAHAKGWQFAPLVAFQALMIVGMLWATSSSDLRVDQQQDRRREDERPENPAGEPERVPPDPRP